MPLDTKMRALHLSTLLLEGGHDFHVEDDGGAARICDEEGNRMFVLSAATMAHICGSTEVDEARAVTTLVAMVGVYGDGFTKGHRIGLDHGAGNLQRMLGIDRIADELAQTRKAVEGFLQISKRQAG